MRTLSYVVLLLAGSLSCQVLAANVKFVAADNSVATRLCISAATDSRLEFRQQVKDSRISIRTVANKLHCNDLPAADFAYQAGNQAVSQHLGRFIHGYVGIRDLALQPLQPAKTVIYVQGSN